jgi:hypothetical protein
MTATQMLPDLKSYPYSNLFGGNTDDFISPHELFRAYFHTIPDVIRYKHIDGVKACEWLLSQYSDQIVGEYKDRYIPYTGKRLFFAERILVMKDNILVFANQLRMQMCLFYKDPDPALLDNILNDFERFRKKPERRKPELDVLVNSGPSLGFETLSIKRPKLSIADNYNDDFTDVHQVILKRLRKDKDKGIVLLHGKPGTGKTSYIRYLITLIKKKVIFLPPNIAEMITSPALLGTLVEHPNSVLVIEDAENIIVDRERQGHSPVSAILNLSDGLLSDCLNIQVICSFNTHLSRLDSALLRKGRLIAKYEFNELEIPKAQALSDKLGFHTAVDKRMTLTEIYNQEERSYARQEQKLAIGFKAVNGL